MQNKKILSVRGCVKKEKDGVWKQGFYSCARNDVYIIFRKTQVCSWVIYIKIDVLKKKKKEMKQNLFLGKQRT